MWVFPAYSWHSSLPKFAPEISQTNEKRCSAAVCFFWASQGNLRWKLATSMANKHSCSHCQLTCQVIERLRLSFPPPSCEVSSGGGRQLKGAVEIISETLYPVAQKSTENYGKVREIPKSYQKWSCKSLKISIHFLQQSCFDRGLRKKFAGLGSRDLGGPKNSQSVNREPLLEDTNPLLGISTVKMTSWWLNRPNHLPNFWGENSQNDWSATT